MLSAKPDYLESQWEILKKPFLLLIISLVIAGGFSILLMDYLRSYRADKIPVESYELKYLDQAPSLVIHQDSGDFLEIPLNWDQAIAISLGEEVLLLEGLNRIYLASQDLPVFLVFGFFSLPFVILFFAIKYFYSKWVRVHKLSRYPLKVSGNYIGSYLNKSKKSNNIYYRWQYHDPQSKKIVLYKYRNPPRRVSDYLAQLKQGDEISFYLSRDNPKYFSF
ncbi:MAG: hypothetical protein LAT68_09295 [Cyclobacteriaceae bacterium]|nr:hypothetical protein [Cyclobacteriaceae bacterium]MCH8516508.1 hypothetical protein [Cyclobacteriaceae bacterium]